MNLSSYKNNECVHFWVESSDPSLELKEIEHASPCQTLCRAGLSFFLSLLSRLPQEIARLVFFLFENLKTLSTKIAVSLS